MIYETLKSYAQRYYFSGAIRRFVSNGKYNI